MIKYIDADKLLLEAKELSGPMTGDGWDNWGVWNLIERQPAVDVRPNIKGHWIKTGQSYIYPDKFICYSCSKCGYDIEKTKFNYCPNCGVKMEGEG